MSAPVEKWNARLAETGPVGARRIFANLSSMTGKLALVRSEVAARRMPVLSVKVPGNDWSGAAAGKYDKQFVALRKSLDAVPGTVAVAVHHEPAKDGTPAAYAAMQRHVLPILRTPTNVLAGPIVNGWWWSDMKQGLTDAEIAKWLPADVRARSEFIAADTYQAGTTAKPGEDAAPKIRNLSRWATRVGVKRLGLGEWNGVAAANITNACNAIFADKRYVFANVFNSSRNNGPGVNWQLIGSEIKAFKACAARGA